MIPPLTDDTKRLLADGLDAYEQGDAQMSLHNYAAALAIYQEFLDKQYQVLGKASPYCATTLQLMADAAHSSGDIPRTRQIMNDLLALKMRYLGPAITDTARDVQKYESFLIGWNLPDEAYQLVDTYMKQANPLHPSLCARALYLQMLSEALGAQGHYEQAYAAARQSCDLKLSFLPLLAVHPKIYSLLAEAAAMAIRCQKWDEVDRALAEAAHYRFGKHEMEDLLYLEQMETVAHAWEGKGQLDRARKTLQNAMMIAQTCHMDSKPLWINKLQAQIGALNQDRNDNQRRGPS